MVKVAEIASMNQRALELALSEPCDDIAQVLERRRSHPYRGFVDLRPAFATPLALFCNNDDLVSLQLFWRKDFSFEPNSLRVWERLARGASTIVDVGAHVGIFALTAAQANRAAQVHAFEAVDYIYARLMVNLFANGLERVQARNIAISDRNDWTQIHVRFGPGILSSGSSVEERASQRQGVVASKWVETVTLDSLFGDTPADLVKIDVEGHEPAVLKGATRLLGDHRAIFICEILREAPNRKDVFDVFAAHDYRCFGLHEDLDRIEAFDPEAPPPVALLNYLFVPTERCDAILARLDGAA